MSILELATKVDNLTAILTAGAVTSKLTTEEAAKYCKVSVETINQHVAKGWIAYSQPAGARGVRYFDRADLEEYMEKNKVRAVEIIKVHKRRK